MKELPLAGKKFLVTRSQHQAAALVALLAEQGGEAICVPTIDIVAPESWHPLDQEIRNLEDVDILILTSVNGVSAFFERFLENEQYFGLLKAITVVAVGPKTAQALAPYALSADIVPQDHSAEGIVAELLALGVAGKKILYPRAELARPYLVDHLRAGGADVSAPIAYRTVAPRENTEKIRRLLKNQELDAICFSSSSTFDNLLAMLGDELKLLLGKTELFSIGPQTSRTIREHGFEVDLEPSAWTLDALVAAMVEHYRN